MSISTRKGDNGETDLMFGRRVAKSHPRIIALGEVDELNAVLGIVLTHCSDQSEIKERTIYIQNDLIVLMGEIGTLPEDLSRYEEKGFDRFGIGHLEKINQWISIIEAKDIKIEGWALPGSSGLQLSASLDHARAVCRRAERECTELINELDTSILSYLNRLSDLLWLMARESDLNS
jgi:cob(I)alamin adenosyltransferase